MPQPWVRTVDPLSSDAADPNDQSDKGSIGKKHVGTIRTGLSQAGRFISKNVRRVLSKEVKGRSNESKPPPQEGPRTDVKVSSLIEDMQYSKVNGEDNRRSILLDATAVRSSYCARCNVAL